MRPTVSAWLVASSGFSNTDHFHRALGSRGYGQGKCRSNGIKTGVCNALTREFIIFPEKEWVNKRDRRIDMTMRQSSKNGGGKNK